MQIIIGLLIGIAVAALGYGFWLLISLLREQIAESKRMNKALGVLAKTFESLDISQALTASVAVNRKLISSAERQTEAIREFTSAFFRQETEPSESPDSGQAGAPPTGFKSLGHPPRQPFRQEYEEFAKEGESGVLTQTEEEIAKEQDKEELKAQGINIDEDDFPEPPEDQIMRG